ncbi:MAG: hypothetical protein DMD79_20400, partial [Candidatus Rokuibacteriota bacterium]
LVALVPVVLTGSLRLQTIVDAQAGLWFVAWPVLGQLAFAAFMVTALASENRIPFDIVEAESELVAGFRVEYSGMKFALIQLAEFVHLFGVGCLGTLLFLGGWRGPGPAALGPVWFVAWPVIGQLAFAAFMVTALASENRIPFDIVEAESELVAGFRVEYSGMKFALIQLAEFVHLFGVGCLGTLLFLGGWRGPGPAALGPVWFVGKAVVLFTVIIWVRWSFIRIRVDQILALSWKLFLPASVALLLATAALVVARGGGG